MLNTSTFSYTGDDLRSDVELTISEGSTVVVSDARYSNTDLDFKFKKQTTDNSGNVTYTNVNGEITDVGLYRVEVTPAGGVNSVVGLGTATQVYTGTFIGDFQVTAHEATFIVKADTDDGKTIDLDLKNSQNYRRHISKKNENGEVLPLGLQVYVNDLSHKLDDDQYDLIFTMSGATGEVRPNQAGTYFMEIVPKKQIMVDQ